MFLSFSGSVASAVSDRALITALFTAGFGLLFLLAAAALLFLRKKKKGRATLTLIGREAEVVRALSPEGFVLVDGELWPARLPPGTHAPHDCRRFRVVGAREHYLEVEPLQASPPGDIVSSPTVREGY